MFFLTVARVDVDDSVGAFDMQGLDGLPATLRHGRQGDGHGAEAAVEALRHVHVEAARAELAHSGLPGSVKQCDDVDRD